jgi:predicted nucleotidyltransferase
MVVNNILDEIFSRWSNVAVLRALNRYAVGISGREVAREAGIAVKNCFAALDDLENIGIVTRVRGGRDHIFSLNRNHFLVKEGVVPFFEIEGKFVETIFNDIRKKLKNKCRSVYVFGSVARKQENVRSDLDLCIIYDKVSQRKVIEATVSELNTELHKKYFVSVAPFFITVSEFIKRAKNNKPPVNDIINEGILILGNSINNLMNDKRNQKN